MQIFFKACRVLHLVAFSNFNNMDLFGSRYTRPEKKTNFVIKKKRGRTTGNEKYGKALNKI